MRHRWRHVDRNAQQGHPLPGEDKVRSQLLSDVLEVGAADFSDDCRGGQHQAQTPQQRLEQRRWEQAVARRHIPALMPGVRIQPLLLIEVYRDGTPGALAAREPAGKVAVAQGWPPARIHVAAGEAVEAIVGAPPGQ